MYGEFKEKAINIKIGHITSADNTINNSLVLTQFRFLKSDVLASFNIESSVSA